MNFLPFRDCLNLCTVSRYTLLIGAQRALLLLNPPVSIDTQALEVQSADQPAVGWAYSVAGYCGRQATLALHQLFMTAFLAVSLPAQSYALALAIRFLLGTVRGMALAHAVGAGLFLLLHTAPPLYGALLQVTLGLLHQVLLQPSLLAGRLVERSILLPCLRRLRSGVAWAICGPARPLAAALPPSPEAEARALVVRSALEEVASGNAGDCGEWETAFLLVEATDCGGLCRTAAGAAPLALQPATDIWLEPYVVPWGQYWWHSVLQVGCLTIRRWLCWPIATYQLLVTFPGFAAQAVAQAADFPAVWAALLCLQQALARTGPLKAARVLQDLPSVVRQLRAGPPPLAWEPEDPDVDDACFTLVDGEDGVLE
eukprot:EG_transcript_6580